MRQPGEESALAPVAGLRLPLAAGMAAVVILIHLLLLSLLYSSLSANLQRSHERPFMQKVRVFAEVVARQLEAPHMAESPPLELNLLDAVIRNGDGVYAALEGPSLHLRSRIGPPGIEFPPVEDTRFGEHDDDVFYVAVPVNQGNQALQLRLGFDERATQRAISEARRRMLATLTAYLGLSAVLALALGFGIARTVHRLQGIARRISSGSHDTELRLHTPIRELAELATDLDLMRRGLVGANASLRAEISKRDAVEQERASLERQLRHHERIETVGTLAGGIAHEFNNVLVPITLLSELTLKQLLPDHPSHADMATVLGAARRARELVRQILAFSRDFGEVNREEIDLREVVDEALRLLRPLVSPNVELRPDYAADLPRVPGSRGLLLQLVMNLGRNALQAIPGEGGVVRFTVREGQGNAGRTNANGAGRTVVLAVEDSGAGMDPAVAARVFEPFFSTRPVGEGTGLGLSVAHGIVRELGGSIRVESVPGKGSTFTVSIPASH